jgi:hypothetical protein
LRLELLPAGSPYDPNFYGGIDELLPNDVAECINGVDSPDHGELWTTPLRCHTDEDRIVLRGQLPLCGLSYQKEMSLRTDGPILDFRYRIANTTDQPKRFLWKLHAALAVAAGDMIDCPAEKGQVVDPAWSRFTDLAPFDWPVIAGQQAEVVPPADGTVDFFYLFDLRAGRMAWKRPGDGLLLEYRFDTNVFPYAWLFASYGGFDGHYTVILEPCTTMPISVNVAAAKNQCSTLGPHAALETEVALYAGSIDP